MKVITNKVKTSNHFKKNHEELKSKSHYTSKQPYPHNTLNYFFNLKDKKPILNTSKQNNNMTRVTFKELHMHERLYNGSQIYDRHNMGHV